jgi:hypothetical protein
VVAQAQAPLVHRAAAGAAQESPIAYERNIFLNCPFDTEYNPLFHAITFAVHYAALAAAEAADPNYGDWNEEPLGDVADESR